MQRNIVNGLVMIIITLYMYLQIPSIEQKGANKVALYNSGEFLSNRLDFHQEVFCDSNTDTHHSFSHVPILFPGLLRKA